jgi:hypothetical protein
MQVVPRRTDGVYAILLDSVACRRCYTHTKKSVLDGTHGWWWHTIMVAERATELLPGSRIG